MLRNLEAVFFVTSPPEIIYDEGVFTICFEIGKDRFRVAMLPRTFVQTRLRGADACAKWQLGQLPDDDKIVLIGSGRH